MKDVGAQCTATTEMIRTSSQFDDTICLNRLTKCTANIENTTKNVQMVNRENTTKYRNVLLIQTHTAGTDSASKYKLHRNTRLQYEVSNG